MKFDDEFFFGDREEVVDKENPFDDEFFFGPREGDDPEAHFPLTHFPRNADESFFDKLFGRGLGLLDNGEKSGPAAKPLPTTDPNFGLKFPSMEGVMPKPPSMPEIATSATKATLGELWNMAMVLPMGLNTSASMLWEAAGALDPTTPTHSFDQATSNVMKSMKAFTDVFNWHPSNELDAEAQKTLMFPLKKLNDLALKMGDQELKQWGPGKMGVLMATATATAVNLLPMMLGRAPKKVVRPALERIALELIEPGERMTRGEMAQKSLEIFEQETVKHAQGEASSPTLNKSTKGTRPKAVVAGELPAPVEETIDVLRERLGIKLEDVINQDPVLTAQRKQGQADILAQHESGELRARGSGPVIPMEGEVAPRKMTPVETFLPHFDRTVPALEWAKQQPLDPKIVAETFRVGDLYGDQAKKFLQEKNYDEAVKAALQDQLYREAREQILGTGSARETPVLEITDGQSLRDAGFAADQRGFDKLTDANRLLEELQLEHLQEYGELAEDLDVMKVGDEFRVVRETPEPEAPDLEMVDEKLDELAPADPMDQIIEEEAGLDKKAIAEARLLEIFEELAKDNAVERAMAEDTPMEQLPGHEMQPLEDIKDADYWNDRLEAEGMGEEPLSSDEVGIDEDIEDLGGDYSKDLFEIFAEQDTARKLSDILNEDPSTTLGSTGGGFKKSYAKLKEYLRNYSDIEHKIIQDIAKLHANGKPFDVDLTYSTGNMWRKVPKELRPKIKFDIDPKGVDVREANIAEHIPLADSSAELIMFDPPFLVGGGKNSIIAQRFSGMPNTEALLGLHRNALKEAKRVLKPGGKIVVKLQDTVYGTRQVWSTEELYAAAIQLGYRPIDKVYYVGKGMGMPPNAKTQRTFKKNISVFYVFEKPKQSYKHIEGSLIKSNVGIPMEDVSKMIGTRLHSGVPVDLIMDKVKEFQKRRLSPDYNPFEGIAAKFDVEWPFQQLGWPELGRRFRLMPSTMRTFQEGLLQTNKKLSSLDLGGASDYGRLTILHENPELVTPELRAKYGEGIKIVGKFLKKWLLRYQNRGGLPEGEGFVENFVNRQLKHVQVLQETLKQAESVERVNPDRIAKIRRKLAEKYQLIERVKKTKYTPSSATWLEHIMEKDPTKIGRSFRVFAHKVRDLPTLKDLVDEGLVTLEQIDIRDILAHYAKRASRDMAMLDIKNAAIKEKVARRKYPKKGNYTKLDKQVFPLFKDYWVDRRFAEYMLDLQRAQSKGGVAQKTWALVKAGQFISLSFLGINNTQQGVMTGAWISRYTPKNVIKGPRAVARFTHDYQEASFNGAFAFPIDLPFREWEKLVKESKNPAMKRLARMLISEGGWPLEHIYKGLQNGAWAFEQSTRMVTYLNLKDRGYSPRMAGEMTALIHGAYDTIPWQTRHKLNWVLFTPTYKMAMAKLWYQSGKSMLRVMMRPDKAIKAIGGPKEIVMERDPKTGKVTRKVSKRDLTLAMFAAMFFGYTYARDKAARKLGYEREYLGWKYYRKLPNGQEIAISMGDAAALPWRILWRIEKTLKPSPQPIIARFFNSFKWEVHPFIRPLAWDWRLNQKPNDKPIYSILDSGPVVALKITQHLARSYIRLIDLMMPDPDSLEDRKVMERDFGWALSKLMHGTVFAYVRKGHSAKTAGRLNAIERQLTKELMQGEGKGYSREQMKNLNVLIESILKEQ